MKYVITEDQLFAIMNVSKQGGISIKRNVLLSEIRSHPLSDEHVWMTPEEEEKKIRKDERERVLSECCSQCPIKEEIPLEEYCAETCEGCLVRKVVRGEP
jgi:hypothetical protein